MSAHAKLEIRKSKLGRRLPSPGPGLSTFDFRLSTWVITALGLLGASTPVFAQSCAMCYNTAASAKAAAIQALRSGILILLIPPILMVVAILARALRSRERFDDCSEGGEIDRELSEWLQRPPLDEPSALGGAGVPPAEEYASKLAAPLTPDREND